MLGEGRRPRLVLVEGITLSSPDNPYLDLKALSAYTGLSRRKLHDLLKDPVRPLPCYRIGGKIVVRRGEYDAWALHYRQVGNADVERIVSDVLREL